MRKMGKGGGGRAALEMRAKMEKVGCVRKMEGRRGSKETRTQEEILETEIIFSVLEGNSLLIEKYFL